MRFVLLLSFLFVYCGSVDLRSKPSNEIITEVKIKYYQDYNSFTQSVDLLAQELNSPSNFESIKQQIKRCRLNYKKVEFIFEYFETEFAYLYVNGGPLPKLHKESSEIDIIDPNGLQTLDELIINPDTIKARQDMLRITHDLQSSLELIKSSNERISLDKRKLIEALRSGIVRVYSLGLTGFDTPGSGNALEEAMVSLRSMDKTLRLLNENNKSSVLDELTNLYHAAIEILGGATFESVDRLRFLIDYVDPIYSGLASLQVEYVIPTDQFKNHAQNYNANSLFDEDFIKTNYFSQYTYSSFDNSHSVALGKILFNDPILSKNIDLSCASCHSPDKAFTDNIPKSKTNLINQFTRRNAPTLIDVGYSSRFFWDMREFDLERQVGHVISDNLEFNMSFKAIVNRLSQSEEYRNLFKEAYKDIANQAINSRSVANAIAAYVNSLKSFDSPFDKYVRREDEELAQEVKQGYNLFMGKANCGTCHFAPVFNGSVPPFYTDAESEVLGVPTSMSSDYPFTLDDDLGRSATALSGDAHPHFNHSFKTVTIRNSELTFPYMHNGAFNSLEEVMTFYNNGGGVGMGLQVENQTLSPDSLGLSDIEVGNIIAFLHSLTDTSGITQQIDHLPNFEDQPYWNQRKTYPVYD